MQQSEVKLTRKLVFTKCTKCNKNTKCRTCKECAECVSDLYALNCEIADTYGFGYNCVPKKDCTTCIANNLANKIANKLVNKIETALIMFPFNLIELCASYVYGECDIQYGWEC
jgi:hypothetical protein